MKRHLWGLALAGVLIGVAGCASDPTADISGTPARIVPTYTKMFMFPGDSLVVTAQVRDEQGGSLPIPVTVTSSDAAIAAVGEDPLPPLEDTRFWVRAEGAGGATLTLTVEGVTEEILVAVFPDVFEGDVSVVTTAVLDTVVLGVGTSGLQFIPGETAVLIDGAAARIVSATADEIKAIPMTVAALTDVTLTVENVLFLPGTEFESTIATLDGAAPVSVTGEDNEPGNNVSGTASPLVLGTPFEGLIDGQDVRDYLSFTLATDRSVDIIISFDGTGGNPDIDAALRNSALGSAGGCSMGTAAQPEECTTSVLTAGTYYVRIDWYDSGSATPPHWYRVLVQ
jgi:hypothetical protein